MILLGLTGSIAMGKSTVAAMFAAAGIPVFDSDFMVHCLYSQGGPAVGPVGDLCPAATRAGFVDRKRLADAIATSPTILNDIEAVVHPLVRSAQERFITAAASAGATIGLLDIPLLFETGRTSEVDRIVVVSSPSDVQRARALQRPGMDARKLALILSKQIPDSEKRMRADYVIDTSLSLADTARQVDQLLQTLQSQHLVNQ